MSGRVGLVLGSSCAPEAIGPTARVAESLGFDELWLSEDLSFTGGVSGAMAALSVTTRAEVGLGIVSAMLRHPALLAMELATIARVFPDRFLPGIGLGVPAWLDQLGVAPASPLAAMRECVSAVRRLLAGEEVSLDGRQFSLRGVSLSYPVPAPLPILMGVVGPRMLALSGAIADGSILSVGAGTRYVEWARTKIDEGRAGAGRSDRHRLVAFAIYAVDEDGERARAAARTALSFYQGAGGVNALTDLAGISAAVRDMVERGGAVLMEREMPDSWVDELTIAGTPSECAARVRSYLSAGADSVALFPVPSEKVQKLVVLTGNQVLPLLERSANVSDGEREARAVASEREEEQATERVVGALYSRFLAADLEGMLALFDEEIAFRFLGQVEGTGVGAARRFFEFAAGLLEDVRFTIEETVVDGSKAAVVWSEEATTRDGAPWSNHGVDVLEVREGRIVQLHENGDCRNIRRHFPRYG